jgi:hypothetical protein
VKEQKGIDHKKIRKRLNAKFKKELSRKIAIENEALIKRILNTPTTVPNKDELNREWRRMRKYSKVRAKFRGTPQPGPSSKPGTVP